MAAPSAILLGYPGWANQREVPTSPPDMSWRTDGVGSFSCEAETKELARLGFTPISRTGIKGRWLWYEHPTAGGWAGSITSTEVHGAFTTINAEDFATNLRKRKLGSGLRPIVASPGTIVLQYLTSSERAGENLGLTGWTAEEGGETIPWEPRGGDLCDEILPELADFGYQWHVRSNTKDERLFEFRRRLGTDKRRRVMLSDGRHILAESVSISGDLWTVANSIEGVAADTSYNNGRGYTLESSASIRTLGRRFEEQIAYTGVATRSTIAPLVKKDLAKLQYPSEVITLDVIDSEDVWRDFREGDTVTVQLESAGVQCPMEIDLRSLSVGEALVSISGRLLVGEI